MPKDMPELPDKENVTAYVDRSVADAVKAKAVKDDRSVSYIAAEILSDWATAKSGMKGAKS